MSLPRLLATAAVLALATTEAAAVTVAAAGFRERATGNVTTRISQPVSIQRDFNQQGDPVFAQARADANGLGIFLEAQRFQISRVDASFFDTLTVVTALNQTAESLAFVGSLTGRIESTEPDGSPTPVGDGTGGDGVLGAAFFRDPADLQQAVDDADNGRGFYFEADAGPLGSSTSPAVTFGPRTPFIRTQPVTGTRGVTTGANVRALCQGSVGSPCARVFPSPTVSYQVTTLGLGIVMTGRNAGDNGGGPVLVDAFSSLDFEGFVALDAEGNPIPAEIFGESGRFYTVEGFGLEESAAPVIPVPPALPLLAGALVSLAALRARRARPGNRAAG
ncbi:MAG: hypothetical protein AAFZ09_12705 [Pseudomonadota bacterium]